MNVNQKQRQFCGPSRFCGERRECDLLLMGRRCVCVYIIFPPSLALFLIELTALFNLTELTISAQAKRKWVLRLCVLGSCSCTAQKQMPKLRFINMWVCVCVYNEKCHRLCRKLIRAWLVKLAETLSPDRQTMEFQRCWVTKDFQSVWLWYFDFGCYSFALRMLFSAPIDRCDFFAAKTLKYHTVHTVHGGVWDYS